MDAPTDEMSARPAEQTRQAVRIPIAVANPAPFVQHATRQVEPADLSGRKRLFERADFLAQLRRELLVSVDAEDPLVRGEGKGLVFLVDVSQPILVVPARPEIGGDLLRGVVAARVQHDDLLREVSAAPQATRKVLLLVKRNEAKRDFHRVFSFTALSMTARVSATFRSRLKAAALISTRRGRLVQPRIVWATTSGRRNSLMTWPVMPSWMTSAAPL